MTAQRVTKLINEQLIPQLDSLLMQDETVASMTLKLVAVLFRTNKIFITRYC